jgi:hypothetical protein
MRAKDLPIVIQRIGRLRQSGCAKSPWTMSSNILRGAGGFPSEGPAPAGMVFQEFTEGGMVKKTGVRASRAIAQSHYGVERSNGLWPTTSGSPGEAVKDIEGTLGSHSSGIVANCHYVSKDLTH